MKKSLTLPGLLGLLLIAGMLFTACPMGDKDCTVTFDLTGGNIILFVFLILYQ